MNSINAQFAHPRGIAGTLAGMVMAVENRERIAWAVSQLDAQPGESILEIGFGPGVALNLLARTVPGVNLAGIDASEAMLRLAERRNRAFIRQGKIRLQTGSAETLPYNNNSFDRAFAINSMQHWPDAEAGLRAMRRILKEGGRIAIVEQPIGTTTGEAVEALAQSLSARLEQSGFRDLRAATRPMRPAATVCVLGTK